MFPALAILPPRALAIRSRRLPGIPRRWRRRLLRLAFQGALLASVTAAGGLQGIRLAAGDAGTGEIFGLHEAHPRPDLGRLERDAIRGSFFSPSGSTAARPVAYAHPLLYVPVGANVRAPEGIVMRRMTARQLALHRP